MRATSYECGETVLAQIVDCINEDDGERIRIFSGDPNKADTGLITITQDEANELIVALIHLLENMGGVTTLYACGYSKDPSY